MAPIESAAVLIALMKPCSILFFCLLFLPLLSQKMFYVIPNSREELLDIRAAVTYQKYQHYDKEYDFPEADPLIALH
jgi:hypothetical protein